MTLTHDDYWKRGSSPEDPPTDALLHDDVRWLGETLGHVIARFCGPDAFEAVENLRKACRARRRNEDGAQTLTQLLAHVDTMPLETASVVARAFTLFFLLINTAEQVHRVRRRRAYDKQHERTPQRASARWAFEQLKRKHIDAKTIADALGKLAIRPVLTAHPTEATRRTILSLQARVADHLLLRRSASPSQRQMIDRELIADVELLWLTDEVRRDRPQVMDEVSTALWYLEDRLVDAVTAVSEKVKIEFEETFKVPLANPPSIQLGSWVGGDRDGNPFVTPEITLAAARRNAHAIVRHYLSEVDKLIEQLSLSTRIATLPASLMESLERDRELLPTIWEANRRRDQAEPVRMKLSFIKARLQHTKARIALLDAGRAEIQPLAYVDAQQLIDDFQLISAALEKAGAYKAQQAVIVPLIEKLRVHGFHGYRIDVRQDAAVHRRVLDEVAQLVGCQMTDSKRLRGELLGRRPLLSPHIEMSDEAKRTTRLFSTVKQIQQECGEPAASSYIISMTRGPDDLLRVLLLAREAGLVDLCADPPQSHVDVVPLFETRADLAHAPQTLRSLLGDEAYRRQLTARGMRQEVMLGYSDAAKDVGVLAASWSLYRAQEDLEAIARDASIQLTLFHGRGGTVGRGGGSPVFRALMALPPKTNQQRIKITEQGEVISQKFGLLPIAERSLEVTITGLLMANFDDWRSRVAPDRIERFRSIMDTLAETAGSVYRSIVHQDDKLFGMFQQATPVRELGNVHFGSRPAYRKRGAGTMEGIRAIPWVFGWTQIRLMLPAWLGAGSALQQVLNQAAGPETLREMAQTWPYFDDLMAKLEMVLAKADLDMARLYIDQLGADQRLFQQLSEEYQKTVGAVKQIRGENLLADHPFLQTAVDLRNPYVDPLSLLQLSLLKRKANTSDDENAQQRIEQILGTTLNGIAQGLRNTG